MNFEKIKAFLSHPAINHSWLAEQLYGDRSPKNRKKISLKVSGQQQFSEAELEKLSVVRKNLAVEIK